MRTIKLPAAVLAILLIAGAAQAAPARFSHVHGLAVPNDEVLVAAHSALYRLATDGVRTTLLEAHGAALAADPAEPLRLFLAAGSDLQRSEDGGASWQPLPALEAGAVEHLAAAPGGRRLYAVAAGQVYREAGKGWEATGRAPEQLIDLAAGPEDGVLYAATGSGLLLSEDGGSRWGPASLYRLPATAVAVAADGGVYAFQQGLGMVRAPRGGLSWERLGNTFGAQVPLRLAFGGGQRLFAATNAGKVFYSDDGGRGWSVAGATAPAQPAARRSQALYQANCASCHGVRGRGESPRTGRAVTLAPALDDTMHAWHHTDDNLYQTIANGPRPDSRMPAWGGRLEAGQIRDLVSYVKSLWTERELGCQGPAHMRPECRR